MEPFIRQASVKRFGEGWRKELWEERRKEKRKGRTEGGKEKIH